MPPDRQMPDQDQRNSSRRRAKWCLSLPVAFSSNFEGEHPGGGQGALTSLPFPPTSREDLQLDGYLEYPYAAQELYIYKHPCLLRDSNPVPTAQQSYSLTTIPDEQLKYNIIHL
ncbi:uncharacterized protein TNCV_1002251 [Trichonephila clavipes]|nr:uncharacterized protein TNCV_1002251 [Trichonephila clavipes]